MHVSSVFVTEKSSRIFFPNTRNSPSAWIMKSNKIVNDPIDNNNQSSRLPYFKIIPKRNFYFSSIVFRGEAEKEEIQFLAIEFCNTELLSILISASLH